MSTLDLLEEFAAGWNMRDVDALLACVTDDGIFHGSAGPESDGRTYRGKDDLRTAHAALWQVFPDAAWNDVRHFVDGDRAVSEWRFTGIKSDGTKVNIRGADIFTLREGKIAVKDTFRKQATQPLPEPADEQADLHRPQCRQRNLLQGHRRRRGLFPPR